MTTRPATGPLFCEGDCEGGCDTGVVAGGVGTVDGSAVNGIDVITGAVAYSSGRSVYDVPPDTETPEKPGFVR